MLIGCERGHFPIILVITRSKTTDPPKCGKVSHSKNLNGGLERKRSRKREPASIGGPGKHSWGKIWI